MAWNGKWTRLLRFQRSSLKLEKVYKIVREPLIYGKLSFDGYQIYCLKRINKHFDSTLLWPWTLIIQTKLSQAMKQQSIEWRHTISPKKVKFRVDNFIHNNHVYSVLGQKERMACWFSSSWWHNKFQNLLLNLKKIAIYNSKSMVIPVHIRSIKLKII